MRIKVKQRHIDNGKPLKCFLCPIALAIQEHFNKPVIVASEYVDIQGNKINLPVTARDFIKNFDNGVPVKPFEFELDYNL